MKIELNDKQIINYEALSSFIGGCTESTPLIDLSIELSNLMNNKSVNYDDAKNLFNLIKGQLNNLGTINSMSTSKRYTNLPIGTRPTSISNREGRINFYLLISSTIVTFIMYALLIIGRLVK